MQTYLREYCHLKTYPVVCRSQRTEMLSGLLFDDREWRVRELRVDLDEPMSVDVAEIETLVDAPPRLSLRVAGAGRRHAGKARRPGYRHVDELLQRDVVARDGVAGRIDDVLVNTRHWALRYFVVRCGEHRTLLHVRWTSEIDSGLGVLVPALPGRAIRTAPAYEGLDSLTPGYAELLYRHYTSREFVL